MSAVSMATQLCDHVALLKKQHKSGVTPTFGQVDDLFDMADRLQHALDTGGALEDPALTCTVRGCPALALAMTNGHPYCESHAREVSHLLTSLNKLLPDLHASLSRVSWPTTGTGRVTGPDPRD